MDAHRESKQSPPGCRLRNLSTSAIVGTRPAAWLRRGCKRALKWCRSILAAARALMVRTDTGRWESVAREDPPWDERNRIIAGFIPAHSAVLDLGSGAQTLRKHLAPDCQYQPCDIIRSSPDVIYCDFNAGIYPALPRKYDYVICSGVFEYIRDPAHFISQVRNYGRKALFSFNPYDPAQSVVDRLACGWLNHLSESQLERLFSSHGLTWRILHRKDLTPVVQEIVYELTPG